jgi:predicted enzyme related to lactoylglutathione lyase
MEGLGELDAITIDCHDPVSLAGFWAAVFGTRVTPPDGEPAIYVDLEPRPGVPILRFQKVPESKTVKNRLHLDVAVKDLDEACAQVERLGARWADDREFSEFGYDWRVMLDPEGNEFCLVIRPS